jgi:hypothetical protein
MALTKWEYCIEFVNSPTGLISEQRLAELGQDGWELAAVHTYMYQSRTFGKAIETAWVFKREKQEGEESEAVTKCTKCGGIMEPCLNALWCKSCGAWVERAIDGLDSTKRTEHEATS